MYKHILKDFRLCPRPLLSINFRGELKKSLEFIHQVEAAWFITKLFQEDSNELVSFLTEIADKPQLGEKKEVAFKEALRELNEIKNGKRLPASKKGSIFEWLSSNVINYIFSITDKWGGPNLPDGIIGILPKENRKFIFWDAKCYDSTRLSYYARKRKNGVLKDVQYVLKSLKQEDTYDEGKLAYYLFITSNTSKEDFKVVQEKITQIIEKNKHLQTKTKSGRKKRNPYYTRMKEIRFCCLNIDELIKIGTIFNEKENREILIRNWEKLEQAFENMLIKDDGYVSSDRMNSELKPLLEQKQFIPKKDTHRKK